MYPTPRSVSRVVTAAVTIVAVLGIGAARSVVAGVVSPQPKMGEPLAGLTPDQAARFDAGRVLYIEDLTVPEGLGPIFNKESCGNCHNNPVGGPGSQTVTRFGSDDGKGEFDPLEQFGGSLLQALAIDEACVEDIAAEANVITSRVTNGALGYGLIEAIPDADLLVFEQDPPGISGRAHMVAPLEDPDTMRVGRFGWKSQVATILTFSADAALNEMGLTNRFLTEENDPNGVRAPLLEDCDTVPDPEDGPDGEGLDFIDRVTDFQRFLAAPPQTPRSGMIGETIFTNVGCGDCHVPSYVTSNDAGLEAVLRNRTIRPYSDFLLHNMGVAGDGIAQGAAFQQELRTPPLWGLGRRDPLWHDGRFAGDTFSARVTAAIMEHGAVLSESETSGVFDNWMALSPADKTLLVNFLASLGRIEFDADHDHAVGLGDWVSYLDCIYASGPVEPDDPCAIHDIDQDGDVDTEDHALFLLVWEGQVADCNGNRQVDLTDIVHGLSLDTNRNAIPDECESCLADLDGSGAIDFGDILALLGAWGPCPPEGLCLPDFDADGIVGFTDLLVVLGSWGGCE